MIPGGSIAALASAPGASPRALIRVSGSLDDLDAIFAQPIPRSRGAHRLVIHLGDGAELPALVAVSVAPSSYTGEDSLDIVIPGGPAIVERVLRVLTNAEGVRHAEAGEFTARAYMNGRLDLEQAKGVAMTIAASNADELRAAQRLMSSTQGSRSSRWNERLSRLLALVEAGIDFADQEDVVAIEPSVLATELHDLRAEIEPGFSSSAGSEQRTDLPRVVLAGAPSAGKSTLFNALVGRERSVVDEAWGTTRDAIVEELTLPGGGRIELVDLAGLDDAVANALNAEVQRRAREEIERADAIVYCDPNSTFDARLTGSLPTLRVRTKADQPTTSAGAADLEVCALDGWHLDELRARLAKLVGLTGAAAGGAIAARLDASLRRAGAHIESAELLASSGSVQWELIAGEMRLALDQLGVITGRIDPDEVLGLIFKTFCIGK
ncbi:MAG: 50S ribosome-binding GTPase [Phycisphaera sp.]|nr:50S ribosome-binding GTPase [Phycisphaera sp.]